MLSNSDKKLINSFDRVMFINRCFSGDGFSSLVIQALNGIRIAEKHNAFPVIYFDNSNNNMFFDNNVGPNVWEYYFKPIFDVRSADVMEALESGTIDRQAGQVSTSELLWGCEDDPDRIVNTWIYNIPDDKETWMESKRSLGQNYVNKYISVLPSIWDKVENYIAENFESMTIGCHVRGTDFFYSKPIHVNSYFEELDKLESIHGKFKIFLATDQMQYVQIFKHRYADRVIVRNCLRSVNGVAMFQNHQINNYEKGEDVLLDLLLLSRCDHIVKCASAVGELALWFNPDLSFTDLGMGSEFLLPRNLEDTSQISAFNVLEMIATGSEHIAQIPSELLDGFYCVEIHEKRTFRWASPHARFRFLPPKGDYVVTIDMSSLSDHWSEKLYTRLNTTPISNQSSNFEHGFLSFQLSSIDFDDAKEHWLCFEFPEIDTSNWSHPDSRKLGAPIFGIFAVSLNL